MKDRYISLMMNNVFLMPGDNPNSFCPDMPAHASTLPSEGASPHARLCLFNSEALMTTPSPRRLLVFDPRRCAAERWFIGLKIGRMSSYHGKSA